MQVLATLANPHRLRVLAALVGERNYVSRLARGLGISRALLQVRLRKLEAAGLVSASLEVSEDGKAMKFYEVAPFTVHLTPQTVAKAARTSGPSGPAPLSVQGAGSPTGPGGPAGCPVAPGVDPGGRSARGSTLPAGVPRGGRDGPASARGGRFGRFGVLRGRRRRRGRRRSLEDDAGDLCDRDRLRAGLRGGPAEVGHPEGAGRRRRKLSPRLRPGCPRRGETRDR
ncbi:putative transcriptional regulator [Frankia sp. QA3]|nr:winged helix-turn-helix domain-containing protein [Frankia sp. QA3]EIV96296.1 putative transcriptional regulator [Frankia sp. QA3]